MAEILSRYQKEEAETPFSPADMARIVTRRHRETPLDSSHNEKVHEDQLPYEGKIVEIDGQRYRYEKVPTGVQRWDDEAQQPVEVPYTLRTWFSHSTEGIGPGPGWDSRLNLLTLTEHEMYERYGHVFTPDEISSPSGKEDFMTGERKGGMPDDVPYYALVPVEKE